MATIYRHSRQAGLNSSWSHTNIENHVYFSYRMLASHSHGFLAHGKILNMLKTSIYIIIRTIFLKGLAGKQPCDCDDHKRSRKRKGRVYLLLYVVRQFTYIFFMNHLYILIQSKCARYWPEENQVKDFGKITLKCVSDSVRADYTLREFMATKEKEDRLIYQYHFQVNLFFSNEFSLKYLLQEVLLFFRLSEE